MCIAVSRQNVLRQVRVTSQPLSNCLAQQHPSSQSNLLCVSPSSSNDSCIVSDFFCFTSFKLRANLAGFVNNQLQPFSLHAGRLQCQKFSSIFHRPIRMDKSFFLNAISIFIHSTRYKYSQLSIAVHGSILIKLISWLMYLFIYLSFNQLII